jgi:hypothetical protein
MRNNQLLHLVEYDQQQQNKQQVIAAAKEGAGADAADSAWSNIDNSPVKPSYNTAVKYRSTHPSVAAGRVVLSLAAPAGR